MSNCRPKAGLKRLAPEKSGARIEGAMAGHENRDHRQPTRQPPLQARAGLRTRRPVDPDDRRRRRGDRWRYRLRASGLYDRFALRRVYYSAFSPIPDASDVLPLQRPPLMREHRLYQSDWLMRFYGFAAGARSSAAADATGMLPLDIDPKLAWALKFRAISRSTSIAHRARCCSVCRAWG
jgi:predicted DNA-binding helix-hairpin-helix protein